jgi:hypothetical protein
MLSERLIFGDVNGWRYTLDTCLKNNVFGWSVFFGDVTGLCLIGDVIGCLTFFSFGDVIGGEQVGERPSICKVMKWLFLDRSP